MALSALARLVRKRAFDKFNTGQAGLRTTPRLPSLPGYARGSLGSTGARPFKPRNSDAGEQRDREFMNDQTFQNFISRMRGV